MNKAAAEQGQTGRLPLWQVVAYAALPLALTGMMSWYTTALLCGVFTLCAVYSSLAALRLSLGALVIGGASIAHVYAALQTGDQKALVAALVVLVVHMLALGLLSHVADTVSDQRSQAWLYVLVPALFLFAPHPLALLGLVGAVLLRHAPDDKVFERRWQGMQRQGWRARWPKLWLFGLPAMALVVTAAALPRASLWGQLVAEMGQTVTISGTVVQKTYQDRGPAGDGGWGDIAAEVQRKIQSEEINSPLPDTSKFVQPLSELLTVVLAATFMLAIGLFLWQKVNDSSVMKHRNLAQAVALLGFPVLLVALLLTSQFDAVQADIKVEQSVITIDRDAEGFVGGMAGIIAKFARSILGDINFYNLIFLLLALPLIIVLGVVIYQLLKLGPRETDHQPEQQLTKPEASHQLLGTEAEPLHRVRHAYARVEAYLAGLGLPRRRSETPAEYLARVGESWPAVAPALAQLAAAYAPVRYGLGVGEREAAGAETVADRVLTAQPPQARGGVYFPNTEPL